MWQNRCTQPQYLLFSWLFPPSSTLSKPPSIDIRGLYINTCNSFFNIPHLLPTRIPFILSHRSIIFEFVPPICHQLTIRHKTLDHRPIVARTCFRSREKVFEDRNRRTLANQRCVSVLDSDILYYIFLSNRHHEQHEQESFHRINDYLESSNNVQ